VRADELAAGDLDGDGRDDLVAFARGAFVFHLGSATGLTPVSATQFAVPAGAPAVVGHFRLDGRADLAALEWSASGGGISFCPASYRGSTVFTWHWSLATGFDSVSRIGLSATPSLLSSADFDGDGRADMFVATKNLNGLVSLRNRGDGGFDVAARLPVPAIVRDLRGVDLDGDGRSELVALLDPTNSPGALAIYDVGFSGQLALRDTIRTASLPSRFDVADFDGDGRLDFAVALRSSLVQLLLARDGGTWSDRYISTLGLAPQSIASADADRDGHPDLVVGATDGEIKPAKLLVFRNAGDATFVLRDSLATNLAARVIAITDLEGDGDPEIVLGTSQTSCPDETAGVYLLRAVNGALALHQGPLFMGGSISSIRVADVTGDGLLDLVTSANRGRVDVRAGLLGGRFGERQEFGVSGGVGDMVVFDADDDGRQDIIVASGNGIAVLPNLGGARPDPRRVSARLGAGGSAALLSWGSRQAVTLIIAGSEYRGAASILPGSVRLAGAVPIPGRARLLDAVSPLVWPDSCVEVSDRIDGSADLEVSFRADEVLDGWLRQNEGNDNEPAAYTTRLTFTATLSNGAPISGRVCAILVGRPHASEAASAPSLRAFGFAPSFESGVGVVLDLPAAATRIEVAIYDVAGRRVAALYQGGLAAGVHRMTWSGAEAAAGATRPGAGIYFVRALVDGRVLRTRILVAR
jgi:hypothetical protein